MRKNIKVYMHTRKEYLKKLNMGSMYNIFNICNVILSIMLIALKSVNKSPLFSKKCTVVSQSSLENRDDAMGLY